MAYTAVSEEVACWINILRVGVLSRMSQCFTQVSSHVAQQVGRLGLDRQTVNASAGGFFYLRAMVISCVRYSE